MIILIRAINAFFQILIYLIIARAVMSWFIRTSYGTGYRIYMGVCQITEPILQPFRKLLAKFGMYGFVDFSPVLAIIGLSIINSLLVNLLRIFLF